jgi:hypothetical protein
MARERCTLWPRAMQLGTRAVCGHKQRTMLCMLVTDATFHLLMSPLKLVASFNCEFITRKADACERRYEQ